METNRQIIARNIIRLADEDYCCLWKNHRWHFCTDIYNALVALTVTFAWHGYATVTESTKCQVISQYKESDHAEHCHRVLRQRHTQYVGMSYVHPTCVYAGCVYARRSMFIGSLACCIWYSQEEFGRMASDPVPASYAPCGSQGCKSVDKCLSKWVINLWSIEIRMPSPFPGRMS